MSAAERMAEALDSVIKAWVQAILHARANGEDPSLILDENSPLVDAARAALATPHPSPSAAEQTMAKVAELSTPADGGGQEVTPLSEEQVRALIVAFCQRFPSYWERLTHHAGQYEIVELNHPTVELVRAIEAAHRIGTPASTGGEDRG